jgi:hypothetical protein
MEKSQPDTEWQVSKKGNLWRRLDGSILIIVENWKGFWVIKDGNFQSRNFKSQTEAVRAAEGKLLDDELLTDNSIPY